MGLNNEFKKGSIYFILDSILAAGVLIYAILNVSSSYVETESNSFPLFIASDIMETLSAMTVEDFDNAYVQQLIVDGFITNKKNTILEQITEFWAKGDFTHARDIINNTIQKLVPSILGFGVWINNVKIYGNNLPIGESLVLYKKIVSGIDAG